MARVYSARLAAGAIDAGDSVVYTVPVGEKAVMLDLSLANRGDYAVQMFINLLPAGGELLEVWAVDNVESGFVEHWQGRMVLNAGDSIVLTVFSLSHYWISGYRFLV